MEKLETRNNRNTYKNLLKSFLKERKNKFVENLEKIGYEPRIIEMIKNDELKNMPCEDINIISQIAGDLKRKEQEKQEQTFLLKELKNEGDQKRKLKIEKKVLFEVVQKQKIVKKEEKKEGKTPKYLIELENKEAMFVKENFPKAFYKIYSKKFNRNLKIKNNQIKSNVKQDLRSKFDQYY